MFPSLFQSVLCVCYGYMWLGYISRPLEVSSLRHVIPDPWWLLQPPGLVGSMCPVVCWIALVKGVRSSCCTCRLAMSTLCNLPHGFCRVTYVTCLSSLVLKLRDAIGILGLKCIYLMLMNERVYALYMCYVALGPIWVTWYQLGLANSLNALSDMIV